MEKALNMGAFEVLDQREMQEVDGGGFFLGLACVCIFLGIVFWPTKVY